MLLYRPTDDDDAADGSGWTLQFCALIDQKQIYRAKKRGHGLMTIILSILNRFQNFFTGRFFGKFAFKLCQKSHRTFHMLVHCLVKH